MADPPPDPAAVATSPLLLHPRRAPFEYGLLPLPSLLSLDIAAVLSSLLSRATASPPRVDSTAVAEALQISRSDAEIVVDALASVRCGDSESGLDPGTADVYELILFLYVQSYKRLLPRSHKDPAAVADVWPSTSAFDGCLSALSPFQLVRSNSRRFMPSQGDEEAHQLSYIQKHLGNMLSLLADSVEGDGDESLVLTSERFEHLGLIIQFSEKESEGIPLSQKAPFFANSDPDMPAVPISAAQVHDWLLENIAISLEHITEKASAKENGSPNASDLGVAVSDACTTKVQSSSSATGTSMHNSLAYSRSQTFVEGISKTSVVKQASDIKGQFLKVLNCHDSVIYILAPLRYTTVYGCSDATIVLGAVGKALRVEHCERVQIITAAKRICIANCRECMFFLGVNQPPLILGDNHKLQVAPFNTYYSQLGEHMAQVGVDSSVNRWNEPKLLGMVDPHDSLSHPAGVSDVQAESATCLDPEQFTNFLIPNWFVSESSESTKYNPFPLPEVYSASQKKKHLFLSDIQQATRNMQIDDNRTKELASALHVHFKDWLYASGNIRQLYCLQGD